MGRAVHKPSRAVKLTAQIGHNGGPDMVAENLFQIIGPKTATTPAVFQCGAPWTGYASDAELKRLGKLQGRMDRRDRSQKEDRSERTKIMMRCIRRMRRENGVE